jgi:hypothetical protein
MDNVLRVCNNGSGGDDNNECSDLGSGCSDGDGKGGDDDNGGNGVGDSGNDGKDDSGDSGGKLHLKPNRAYNPPYISTVIIVTVT